MQSWFVAEHQSRGLPSSSLSTTLALVSELSLFGQLDMPLWSVQYGPFFGNLYLPPCPQVTTSNSLLAILAGLLADLLVRGLDLGPLAPFLAALVAVQL